ENAGRLVCGARLRLPRYQRHEYLHLAGGVWQPCPSGRADCGRDLSLCRRAGDRHRSLAARADTAACDRLDRGRWRASRSGGATVAGKAPIAARRHGAFVASSGAEFTDLTVAGSTITAEALPGSSLRFIGRGGRLLRAVSANSGSYRVTGNEGYVRVEAVRDDGARAWSQPFFISW